MSTKKRTNKKRQMLIAAFIYNNQNLEATQMFIKRRMDVKLWD